MLNWEATLRQEALCSSLTENLPCPGAGACRRHVSAHRHYSKNHPICQGEKSSSPFCGDDSTDRMPFFGPSHRTERTSLSRSNAYSSGTGLLSSVPRRRSPSSSATPSTCKAVHGGNSKNDRIDSHKIAVLLRGGTLPVAYVYLRKMHST